MAPANPTMQAPLEPYREPTSPYLVHRGDFRHDGKRIPEGGVVHLTARAARPLELLGAISPAPEDAATAALDADVTAQIVEQAPELADAITEGGGVDAAATIADAPKPPRKSKAK